MLYTNIDNETDKETGRDKKRLIAKEIDRQIYHCSNNWDLGRKKEWGKKFGR